MSLLGNPSNDYGLALTGWACRLTPFAFRRERDSIKIDFVFFHGRGTVSENLRWFVVRGHCRGFFPRFLGEISCNLWGIVSVSLVAMLGDFLQ